MPGVPGVVCTPWAHGKMLKVHRTVQNHQLSLGFPIRPSEALGARRQDVDGVAGRVGPELSFRGSRRGRHQSCLESVNPTGGVSVASDVQVIARPTTWGRGFSQGLVQPHLPVSLGLLHLLLWQLLPPPICGCVVAPQDPPQPAWFSSLQLLACEQEIYTSQTSPRRCYSNSKAEINIFKLKCKTPRANVHAALFVLEILLAAVQLKSSVLLIANRQQGPGHSKAGMEGKVPVREAFAPNEAGRP